MPKVFCDYQARWVADKARVKIMEKSRRIGISWAEAADDALLAAKSREAGGMDVWYISYNKEMTETFIKDVAEWAKKYNLAAAEMEEFLWRDNKEDEGIQAYRVRFASGFAVTGLSSAPRNLRSKQGKIVLDEAAFVESLDELLKAAMAMLVWGGSLVVISTHNGEDNPFAELVQDVLAGKKPYSLHRVTLDDALGDGLYRRICEVRGQAWSPEAQAAWRKELIAHYGDDADEELFCIPRRGSGAYLARNIIEACMDAAIPVLRWSPPAQDFVDWPLESAFQEVRDWCQGKLDPLLRDLHADHRHYLGGDFARSGHLSVYWPLARLENLCLHTPFVLEVRDAPFRVQEQLVNHVLDRVPHFSGAGLDARGNGQAVAEFTRQRYGPDRVAEVMISDAWYRVAMPKLKAHYEDRTIDAPRDANILDDLRAVKMVRGVPKIPDKVGRDDRGQRHGDGAVAQAMAVYAESTIEYSGPVEVTTGAPRQSSRLLAGYA